MRETSKLFQEKILYLEKKNVTTINNKIMKTLKRLRSVLAMGLAVFALTSAPKVEAQVPKLPLDSAIRTGKLDNGLTYFIRHNEKPEGRAEFYIAQRVGSTLEKDSQSGLAHFLEHMAFNGTKNFPDKGIINYLETKGVSFGSNINAYTGFDETVYTLMNVPSKEQQVIDSCILVLHDWSNAITLADKEIDAERGVIEEEWRSRDTGNLRTMFSIIKQALPSTKYGERFPIGSMDVVRNFKYKELRDYYKKWYRPDLQAVIIVGDIDVKQVEASLKRIFADIPKPVNPAERTYQVVTRGDSTIVAVATDPEVGRTRVDLQIRMDDLPHELKGTMIDYASDYMFALVSQMTNARFAEILQKPNPPFLSASFSFMPFAGVAYGVNCAYFSAQIKDQETKEGLDALVRELERIKRYGFTAGEFDRAKKDYMVTAKKRYAERKNRKNGTFANQYVQYFTKQGGYLLDADAEYELDKQLDAMVKLEAVNNTIAQILSDKDRLLGYTGPEKKEVKTPTKAELLAMLQEAEKQKVEPYKEEVSDMKLMETKPKAGKIVKVEKGHFGSTIWKLSNGAKVVIKPTKLKEDEILLNGSRLGGTLALRKKVDRLTLKTMPAVMNLGGLGKYDNNQLTKVLTGRIASAGLSIGETTDNVSGSCVGDDLETMLQLLYLNFTAKRSDETAFKTFQERVISSIKSAKANPMSGISDTIARIAYPGDLYKLSLTEDEVTKLDYKRIMEVAKQCFSGVRDFTFIFVGNVDEAKLRPLVETYIASLPKGSKRPKVPFKKIKSVVKGKHVKHYEKKLTTPMGLVLDIFTGQVEYSRRNKYLAYFLSEILDQAYTASIREKEGGTYGVSTGASIDRHPNGQMTLQIYFQTEPSKAEHLNKLVRKELDDIIKNGVNAEYFDKAIKSTLKKHKEQVKENSFWLSSLNRYYFPTSYGQDYVSDYEEFVKSLKKEEIQALLKQLMEQKNEIELILRPLAEQKAEAKS